jgi:hypothetical protein
MRKALATIGTAAALSLLTATPASAAPPDRSEVTTFVGNPCNGDTALVEGTLTQHFQERKDGGFTLHFRLDASGTGQLTGDRYEFDQNWHSQSVTDPNRFSLRERFVVQNKSGGPTFTSVFVLRFADGELVTEVNDQTCSAS